MACIYPSDHQEPELLYPYILENIKSFLEGETDWVANAANAAATVGFLLHDLNWVGFYLMKDNQLKLGPFWGKPAVTTIKIGEGVCGTSAETQKTIVVKDVHQFPGHIACDLFSNSEIVLPLFKDNQLIGVLDIDSPEIGRFSETDQIYLEEIAHYLSKTILWPK
ncbi:GAF domain-containing protein [Fusibacter sp. 3D3]|uniref:GAF domain-containing protein n=1 Tax=Fusibacter sp. 3D3 TaxID=1048380 RepID=UPI000853BF76|nr:GAF domain-containing protein [Fusibacter sp. 3D3]GAU77355.1 free methionine-(R)-sulfoxide reductase, contains GAF domain [Fusibacter sp. 3D3]